jgi:hypothetical protein
VNGGQALNGQEPGVRSARGREDERPGGASFRAELDVPGETGRQAKIFAIWAACLALAVLLGALVGAHVPIDAEGSEFARVEFARARADRAQVGVLVGLVLPALLTWGLHARHRRGGAHARGIVVDVTEDGELRIWGRGYGSRVALAGAAVSERLVDVYGGRLGAWRQRRLRVRGASAGRAAQEIELATLAVQSDLDSALRVEGGEGDCVELRREDFDQIRALVTEATSGRPAALRS